MDFESLFTGIGGFDLGFERAGMHCITQVEINEDCLQLLADKWPNVERVNDVKKIVKLKSTTRLVCGGFPCQDVSLAGGRAGLVGERSGLWYDFIRIIEHNQPGWVIVENVPGLLSSNDGLDFATIISGLVKCGYGVCWRVLDAQYFGVAQHRRRIFIVGHLGDGCAAEVLFERESLPGDPAQSREQGQDEKYANSASAGARDECWQFTGSGRITAANNYGQKDTVGALSTGGMHLDADTDTFIIKDEINKLTGSAASIRRIMPLEAERLQGFPDHYTAGFNDGVRYEMLGNSVAVPVIEWLGKRIMQVENKQL